MAKPKGTNVTLVKGKKLKYPSNVGNYSTNYFYVNGKIAYCLESPKSSPPDSDYIANILETNAKLQKVLYYGYGGPGDLTGEYLSHLDVDTRYIYTHIAASYAYIGKCWICWLYRRIFKSQWSAGLHRLLVCSRSTTNCSN